MRSSKCSQFRNGLYKQLKVSKRVSRNTCQISAHKLLAKMLSHGHAQLQGWLFNFCRRCRHQRSQLGMIIGLVIQQYMYLYYMSINRSSLISSFFIINIFLFLTSYCNGNNIIYQAFLCARSYFKPFPNNSEADFIMPILQMRKLKHRVVKLVISKFIHLVIGRRETL